MSCLRVSSRGIGVLQRRRVVKDLLINFSQDSGVGAKGGRDVLAAQEEANSSFEEGLQFVTIDELGQTGHVCGRQHK